MQTKLIIRLAMAAAFSVVAALAPAQQASAQGFFNSYESAVARAADKCRKLWADLKFDPLRDKVPLGPQKPTMEMLTSSARLEDKDKPLAREAITVVINCRTEYAPAYAMLPGSAQTLVEGLYREEDALIAQLYNGKITFGDFNVSENRLAGEILRAFARSTDPTTSSAPNRRAEFNEWTLYGANDRGFPQFIKINSIRQIGDKVSVQTRYVIDPVASGKKFTEGSYREDLMVTHCTKPIAAMAESRVIDPKGKPLYAYKWADPEYLDLAVGGSFTPGSVAALMQKIVCNEGLRTPLLSKQELAAMKFSSLSSTTSGDGDVFYAFGQNEASAAGSREINLIVRLHRDVEVSLSKRPVSGVPSYRTQVSRISLNCTNGTMELTKAEYYDVNYNLVYLDTNGTAANEILDNSPVGLLRRIVCNANEAGK